MPLQVKPILGSIRLDKETLVGERNSTRWILLVAQDYSDLAAHKPRSVSFQLVHGVTPMCSPLFSFHFGALDEGYYKACPWLEFDEKTGTFRVLSREGVAATYQLSIDMLHSMHR